MLNKTAIIIVNWNSLSVTDNCIKSLQEMNFVDFDIILIDNDSRDGSGEKLKEYYPEVFLIKSDLNRGFAGGNNLGIEYAIEKEYQYILLLNNDTIVKKDFLPILINYMDKHPETGGIQPLIYFEHDRSLVWNGGSTFYSWIGHPFVCNYSRPLKKSNNNVREVDWITGCVFLIRTPILKKIGYLKEQLFMYYEDVDLSFRIKNEGYNLVYQPNSIIYHIAGKSLRENEKGKEGYLNASVHYYNIRNRIWLIRKYTPLLKMPTVTLYYGCYIVALILYFILRFRIIKLKTVFKAISDGLKLK